MFKDRIFKIQSKDEFQELALEVFKFQFEENTTYRSYCDLLNIHYSDVKCINDIPFLPIEFFKQRTIVSSNDLITHTFTSSGTTGSIVSKHHVTDIDVYIKSFTEAFNAFYGAFNDYVILALLPSYLERNGSSLVYMVDYLIKHSNHTESGFYLNNLHDLKTQLTQLDKTKKVLLIGVSFALLDLVEDYEFELKNTIVMETGGMKGRRKELVRQELHDILKNGFGVTTIHSEYGMTELLSQAYSMGNGIFNTPPWMEVLIRDPEDPLTLVNQASGGVNIIDLANYNSCSFIATQDLGKKFEDGSFDIIGRFDQSDIRGCNLMVL